MSQKAKVTLVCDRCGTQVDNTPLLNNTLPHNGFYAIKLSPVAGGGMIDPGDICSVCTKDFQKWMSSVPKK